MPFETWVACFSHSYLHRGGLVVGAGRLTPVENSSSVGRKECYIRIIVCTRNKWGHFRYLSAFAAMFLCTSHLSTIALNSWVSRLCTVYLLSESPSRSGSGWVKSNRSDNGWANRDGGRTKKKMNDIDCWDSDALTPWYTHLAEVSAVHIYNHFYTNCLNCNSLRCAMPYVYIYVCMYGMEWNVYVLCTFIRPLTFTKMPMPNSTAIK